jgi:Acyl-CoA oxidase
LIVGDNYVISQQTARACLRYQEKPVNLPSSAKYFANSSTSAIQVSSESDWKNIDVQMQVLQRRSKSTVLALSSLMKKRTPFKDLNMECVAVSRAHAEVFVLGSFIDTASSISDDRLRSILTKLRNLVYFLSISSNFSTRSISLGIVYENY